MNVSSEDYASSINEELLEFLYLMPIGVVKFCADGRIDLINPVAASLLIPLTPDGLLDNLYKAMALLVPDLQRVITQFAEPAGTIIDKQRLEAHAGSEALVLSLSIDRINGGVYMAVIVNVTKIAAQERQIFSDRERFRAIFNNVRDYAIYTTTVDGTIEEWNQSLQRYAGWRAADIEGRNIEMFFPEHESDVAIDELLAEAKRIGSIESEGWRLKLDGSRLWENTVITALPDEVGAVRGFAVVARDMTERKRTDDAVKRLATVDQLTGAYNRRYGDALLTAECSRYDRSGQSFAVLMLDVDHFKTINDQFGHPAGDEVLCALVRTCQATLRAEDTVARWGGEEFLLLLPGADIGAALRSAERVRAALAATPVVIPGGASIDFTVSIGVAVPTGNDPKELLRRSDMALYEAKIAGRNQIVPAA